jgi:hypothetical protein
MEAMEKFSLAFIPVYLQLTKNTPLEHLCTYPNNSATAGNIFGLPVVE